jgi:hypothetical protein
VRSLAVHTAWLLTLVPYVKNHPLGGFKLSSQHLVMEVSCGISTQESSRTSEPAAGIGVSVAA